MTEEGSFDFIIVTANATGFLVTGLNVNFVPSKCVQRPQVAVVVTL